MRSWSLVKIVVILTCLAALGAVSLSIWAFRPSPTFHEIAVLYPSTSQDSWTEFVDGARLAAQKRGLVMDEDLQDRSVTVQTNPVATKFTWYPALGSTGMQARVREICQRKNPPLAIIGSDNSALTEAIGSQIADASRPDWRPPLLMTWATADGLIHLNENRTYRFGFNNHYQASEVVRRLAEEYVTPKSPEVKALIVQVLDNPFSLDLARNFEVALREKLAVDWLKPDAEFEQKGKGADVAWSLPTAAGSMESSTPEERRLVAAIVDRFRQSAEARLVLVLPVGRDLFERITRLLQEEADALSEPLKLSDRLTILTGDTLGYYAFDDAPTDQLDPRFIPAPVVFFSHVNPLDRTVSEQPSRRTPSVGLHRDLVDTLLEVIPSLGPRATPETLCEKLNTLHREDELVFERGERRLGGHALVAIPSPDRNSFAIVLPQDWKTP